MDKVLCGANAQSMKWFFNEEEFGLLPSQIRDDLKVICVNHCADVGGILLMSFNDENQLNLQTIDPIDEIGAELSVKRLQNKHAELFGQLETFAEKLGEMKK